MILTFFCCRLDPIAPSAIAYSPKLRAGLSLLVGGTQKRVEFSDNVVVCDSFVAMAQSKILIGIDDIVVGIFPF